MLVVKASVQLAADLTMMAKLYTIITLSDILVIDYTKIWQVRAAALVLTQVGA